MSRIRQKSKSIYHSPTATQENLYRKIWVWKVLWQDIQLSWRYLLSHLNIKNLQFHKRLVLKLMIVRMSTNYVFNNLQTVHNSYLTVISDPYSYKKKNFRQKVLVDGCELKLKIKKKFWSWNVLILKKRKLAVEIKKLIWTVKFSSQIKWNKKFSNKIIPVPLIQQQRTLKDWTRLTQRQHNLEFFLLTLWISKQKKIL